ncbi:MAG: ATP-dependent helicase [Parabacteroides sp.]
MEEYLAQLNEAQRAAVTYVDGPALVIAGAGSGKTRVLTYKIAYLMQQGMKPYHILALTFTNKAAREMKERVARVVGEESVRQLWMGTFHSIFSRILRREAAYVGYPSNFTIYDASDSKNLLKSIIKEMQLDDKTYRPSLVQGRISRAKNALITAKGYASDREMQESDLSSKVPLIRDIYQRYQNRCVQAGAMDFDDLLLQTYRLFHDYPEVLARYRDLFQYVLVDEYQDTNYAQHQIMQQLCVGQGQICVVGDDAQSIYSFRGADIDNILKFKNCYSGCRIFKLERNYRSTQIIVNAANSLIHKNRWQIEKRVYSEKDKGQPIPVFASYSDYEEAYTVASRLIEMRRHEYTYADFAILYRTNAQSRVLEEVLRKRGVPYRVYGGLSFYQRKEIKDVLSYFRLAVNPHDEEALKRVINYPARGIGDTTVGKLVAAASQQDVSLWHVLCCPSEVGLQVNSGTAKKLDAFRTMMEQFIQYSRELPADEAAVRIIKESSVLSVMAQDRSVEGVSRQENLQELLNGVVEFCKMRQEEGSEHLLLEDFLSEVSLMTDQDNDKEESADKVTMMTVHAAKGLEFKNVFVVGLEEDLFPSMMSKDSPKAIEEERRLFYVAITRAEEHCLLSYAKSRYRNGKTDFCSPSRFLQDIDSDYLDLPSGSARRVSSTEEVRQEVRPVAFRSPLRQIPESYRKLSPVSSSTESPQRPQSVSSASVAVTPSGGLCVGAHVRHERFGDGRVLAMEGEGSNLKVTVSFSLVGQKQLLAKFARLTLLDS